MTRRLNIALGTIFFIATMPQPGPAQTRDDLKTLQKEVQELKERQERTEKELEAIKNFLLRRRRPQPFKPVVLSVGDNPYKGNQNAKVTLLDFSDYQ